MLAYFNPFLSVTIQGCLTSGHQGQRHCQGSQPTQQHQHHKESLSENREVGCGASGESGGAEGRYRIEEQLPEGYVFSEGQQKDGQKGDGHSQHGYGYGAVHLKGVDLPPECLYLLPTPQR